MYTCIFRSFQQSFDSCSFYHTDHLPTHVSRSGVITQMSASGSAGDDVLKVQMMLLVNVKPVVAT